MIVLLSDDDLGAQRESPNDVNQYKKAFELINEDINQYLMVLDKDNKIIGTCDLTESKYYYSIL